MNFYFYSKYNGKSTIEQLRRVTFFVSSSSFHIVYNSVSIFSLIDNVQSIQYNFSGSTYTTTRKMIEENYPHFEQVKENEKNFNQYLENKINDDEFTRSIFNKIFVKKGL